MKISQRVSELSRGCSLYSEIFKGALFCKCVDGVMVLVLSTLSDSVLYLYQVLLKYLIGFQSYGPDQ